MSLNPNSARFWFDASERVTSEYDNLSVPETRFVEFELMKAVPLLEGQDPAGPTDEIEEHANKLGWPVFIRTDLTSAKKDGIKSVRATSNNDILRCVASATRSSVLAQLRPSHLLVREWIDIESEFTAFEGLPVGVEFRIFASPSETRCVHYYWPEESLRDVDCDLSEAKQLRNELENTEIPSFLNSAAQEAALYANRNTEIPSDTAWSVDVVRDTNGNWWLLDMALASDSWHPEQCRSSETRS